MARTQLMTLVAALLLAGCGGPSTPTSPTSSSAANSSTFNLTGLVIDDANQVVVGATVTALDGPNANASALTDAGGRYSLTGLRAGGFSVRVRRDGYDDASRAITLANSMTADFTITRIRINLAGASTGTYTFINTAAGQPLTRNMTATIAQTGTAISGTFRITFTGNPADDWTGSFSGTLSSLTPTATYTGSLTVSALITTGSGRCNGTRSSITGTATQSQLVFSAPGLWNWNECSSTVQNTVITLNR